MVLEEAWKLFGKILSMSEKEMKMQSHLAFLKLCMHENLIPKGLRNPCKITFADEGLIKKCQARIDRATFKTMRLYIGWLYEEINNKRTLVKDLKMNLYRIVNGNEFGWLLEKLERRKDKIRRQVDKVKKKKIIDLRREKELKKNDLNIDLRNGRQDNNGQKRRSRRKCRRKRSAKSKRRLRKNKIKNMEKDLIDKIKDVDLPPTDRFKPFDNTSYQLNEAEMNVCAKGLKFIPMVKRVDYHQKENDFQKFARVLRLAVYHHRMGNNMDAEKLEQVPWKEKSNFEPAKNMNQNLEKYLEEVHKDLFSPKNLQYVEDNMSKTERLALKSLRTWNKDDSNPRMFRLQDKGACFTIEWKENYKENIEGYLLDETIFFKETEDQSEGNKKAVEAWAKKWKSEGIINKAMEKWIIPKTVKPACIHGNLKTHKVPQSFTTARLNGHKIPYRFIVSLFGAATEKLARWSELFLKKHAGSHKAYLKDTKSFLAYIEDINIRKAPMDHMSTVLTTRDIENYYPSCDLQKSIEAVGNVLRRDGLNEKRIECMKEAVELTMTKNNIMFLDQHYTQIDGATIGGPNSGSVTDIFGAEFIDKIAENNCPYKMEEYKRYRDDTFDINTNSSLEEQAKVTEWLNENIFKEKIKFTEKSSYTSVNFLDVKVSLNEGWLKTEMYSKPTDINQYLNPKSCHPPHIFRGIPKSVAIRLRRICSERWEGDSKFIDGMRRYKGYLITSGYEEKSIDLAFASMATKRRSSLLEDQSLDRNSQECKYRFMTAYEPAFPNIHRYLSKHKDILIKDKELKKIFPHNTRHFQISYRRGGLNMKEILAPSKTRLLKHEEEGARTEPCGKQCVHCPKLEKTRGTSFRSSSTRRIYKIRQKINCDSKNVVYLIICGKHQIQGVGQTTDIKKRLSNYWNHHRTKYKACGITEHFLEEGHNIEEDFIFQPIVKLANISNISQYQRPKTIRQRLEEFELYWQEVLMTIEPYGMNKREEVEKARKKIMRRKKL